MYSVGGDEGKGGNRDAGREWERLPKDAATGIQCRAGGVRVIHQKDVPHLRSNTFRWVYGREQGENEEAKDPKVEQTMK